MSVVYDWPFVCHLQADPPVTVIDLISDLSDGKVWLSLFDVLLHIKTVRHLLLENLRIYDRNIRKKPCLIKHFISKGAWSCMQRGVRETTGDDTWCTIAHDATKVELDSTSIYNVTDGNVTISKVDGHMEQFRHCRQRCKQSSNVCLHLKKDSLIYLFRLFIACIWVELRRVWNNCLCFAPVILFKLYYFLYKQEKETGHSHLHNMQNLQSALEICKKNEVLNVDCY
jgi:hypothetical protein